MIIIYNFIHDTLEGGRCIKKSKWNNQKIIVAFMGAKCCHRNVDFFHFDMMISRVKIQFGEILSSMKLIQ